MPAGYVLDTPYADTFFRELSPAWLNYVVASGGGEPVPLDAPFTYLELGCGFGTSTVVNAGAFPRAAFHACDFNDAHITAARDHAATLGIENVTFHRHSFEELVSQALPSCDFVVLHGVYSWIDADARASVRQVIAHALKPGGIAYVSYNALPGWSTELPLRRLLVELAASGGGTSAGRMETAAATMKALSAAGLRYFTANPTTAAAVDAYVRGEGHYLAHEFMNAAWEPFYAIDVADELASIGLRRIGSATLAENHPSLVLDAKSAAAIAALATDRQQQLAVDFATNQRFRRDVFVRTAEGGGPHPDALQRIPIGCPGDVDAIATSARVPRGEIRFQDAFIRDVRALMREGSHPFGQLVDALGQGSADRGGIERNVSYLVAAGVLAPFAMAGRRPANQPTRIAGTVVARALADVERRGVRRAVPSPVYGNGVEAEPSTARAVREWAAASGEGREPLLQGELRTFARLGLVE